MSRALVVHGRPLGPALAARRALAPTPARRVATVAGVGRGRRSVSRALLQLLQPKQKGMFVSCAREPPPLNHYADGEDAALELPADTSNAAATPAGGSAPLSPPAPPPRAGAAAAAGNSMASAAPLDHDQQLRPTRQTWLAVGAGCLFALALAGGGRRLENSKRALPQAAAGGTGAATVTSRTVPRAATPRARAAPANAAAAPECKPTLTPYEIMGANKGCVVTVTSMEEIPRSRWYKWPRRALGRPVTQAYSPRDGSGLVIDARGHVVTTIGALPKSPPAGPFFVTVETLARDGNSSRVPAEVVGDDYLHRDGLVVLRADGLGLGGRHAETGSHLAIEVGEPVHAMGGGAEGGIVPGVLEGMRDGRLQSSIALPGEYVGGPLFDRTGRVMGLNSASGAVPIERVVAMKDDLVRYGGSRGALGVQTAAAQLVESPATPGHGGASAIGCVRVHDVSPGGPAARAGISPPRRAADGSEVDATYITHVWYDGGWEAVNTPDYLIALTDHLYSGDSIRVYGIRLTADQEGQEFTRQDIELSVRV